MKPRPLPKLIYIFVYALMALLLLKIVYNHLIQSYFQVDLLWFVPAVYRAIQGLSPGKLFNYFTQVLPIQCASPTLRVYTYAVLSLFGPQAKYFILAAICFHFLNSWLLLMVTGKLGFGFRTSFFSSLSYLLFFAHFDAYLWPMAFQHLIVVFFILSVLNFYLKTEALIDRGERYFGFFLVTLILNCLATFCRPAILILPALILTHILFAATDERTRIRKFDLWLPLFISYLFRPLVIFSIGDPQLLTFLTGLHFSPINKFLILFTLGLVALVIFRFGLIACQRRKFKNIVKWTAVLALIASAAALIYLGGLRRLLIPYNMLAPFVGTLAAFLYPIQNALLIDSTRAYHLIPLQLNLFNWLLTLFILTVFIKRFACKRRQLVILAVWYMFTLGYLYLRNPFVSRYFIYLSPLFCIIFCSVFVELYSNFTNKTKLAQALKEAILILLFMALLIPNALAIKLPLFKDKLVNNFVAYDYIRAAKIIKQDLFRRGQFDKLGQEEIYITGAERMPEFWTKDFVIGDPYFDNFRFILMQELNLPAVKIKINEQLPEKASAFVYSLAAEKTSYSDKKEISPFFILYTDAKRHLKQKRFIEAAEVLKQAIELRPHLLNFILAEFPIEDLESVINKQDLRTWINQITCFWRRDYYYQRASHISSIIDTELDSYIECLFYYSYLSHIAGQRRESEYWASQIRFLDADCKRLTAQLREVSLIKSDKGMTAFLGSLQNTSLYVKFDDYTNRFNSSKMFFRLLVKE